MHNYINDIKDYKLITYFSRNSTFLLFCWWAFAPAASIWWERYTTVSCCTPLPNYIFSDIMPMTWTVHVKYSYPRKWKMLLTVVSHPHITPGNCPDCSHSELYRHLVYFTLTRIFFYQFMPFKNLSRAGVVRWLSRWRLLPPASCVQPFEPMW